MSTNEEILKFLAPFVPASALAAAVKVESDRVRAKRRELRAIEMAGERQKDRKDLFLRRHGWICSSAYPDCRWRWSKLVRGISMTCVSADDAIGIEGCLK